MDEKFQAILNQLREGLMGIPEEQISTMLREAQEEALAEAKEILKTLMVRATLERAAMQGLQSNDTTQDRPPAGLHHPLPVVKPHRPDENEAHVREEVEAIRRKIAENEQLLSQIKFSPPTAPCTPRGDSQVAQDGASLRAMPPFEPDEDEGYYVYGIAGITRPSETLPEKGIDPAFPVYALPHQTIQAILSRVSLQEFGQEALKANLNNPAWLEAKVRTHQAVLEAISADSALIPMKFCTIYLSEARVQEILAQYHDDFIESLARLDGKKERGVKVFCHREKLARWVGVTNEKVKSIQLELTGKSNGVAYFARKKLEAAIAEQIERIGDECAQSSHDRLAACAAEARVTPLQSQETTGRKEQMVLNGAYLVAEEKVTTFRSEVESLENEYGPLGFCYELTGPWPPYNFVTIAAGEGIAHE